MLARCKRELLVERMLNKLIKKITNKSITMKPQMKNNPLSFSYMESDNLILYGYN